jgi:5-methylcytosine-specific restriction endonuclease McrA
MTGKKHKNAFLDPQSTWYKLQRWRRRARLQLAAEPLCAYCLELGKVRPARVADHIVAVDNDWSRMWTGRLQSLCKSCHDSVKAKEERKGYRPGFDEFGMPLDSKHPAYQPRRWAR